MNKEFIEHLIQKTRDMSSYLSFNEEKLDIYQGNILHHVNNILQESLSANYYDKIKSRIVPINVLTRVIDKMSKVYIKTPDRISETHQDWVDEIEKTTAINTIMGTCDSYANLFKGYLIQPYVHNREMKLRPIAYDRFIPLSDDKSPEHMNGLLVYMGKVQTGLSDYNDLWYYYDDKDFLPFTTNGNIYAPALEGNDGVNPYGFIPFVYGNRSITKIIPKQDTDIAQISKMIPVVLSDLAGAIMFQCFSIIYGIDINAENMTMTPNAFWSLKSDKTSDKTPSVGTIKPQVDISEVREYVIDVFSLWLETKGVRVGSVGSVNGARIANGISKIIDEMDVFEIRKESIQFFMREEEELWGKLRAMNNHWSKAGEIDTEVVGDNFDFSISFEDPRPELSREEKVRTLKREVESGLTSRKQAMKTLHPDLTDEQIEENLKNGVDKNENQDSQ